MLTARGGGTQVLHRVRDGYFETTSAVAQNNIVGTGDESRYRCDVIHVAGMPSSLLGQSC